MEFKGAHMEMLLTNQNGALEFPPSSHTEPFEQLALLRSPASIELERSITFEAVRRVRQMSTLRWYLRLVRWRIVQMAIQWAHALER